ncbi:MAG: VWA domain-containing protein [Terriglobia bacterium]
MNVIPPRSVLAALLFAGAAVSVPVAAQEPKPPAQTTEMAASESTFKLRAERNVVVVRVVVRDVSGKAVTGLYKEDFRLFDNGKPQTIFDFSAESPATKLGPAAPGPAAQPSAAAPTEAEHPVIMPERFVALFFDDVHISFSDMVRTRDAAGRYISTNLQPSDRAALFTASGDTHLDFTADRDRLRDALLRIRQHPMPAVSSACPKIDDYQAYQIVEQEDQTALQVAEQDALVDCCARAANCPQMDPNYLESVSREILDQVEFSSRQVFQALELLARQMATQPGQRSVVFLSPGFFTEMQTYDLNQVVDRALRAGVVINTLDARGLYVDLPLGDASQETVGAVVQMAGPKSRIHQQSMMAQTGVLAALASGTGGIYFHDSNDYDAGFRRTGGLPEASYVLTFSPENLKSDGTFHKLKVTLANPSHLAVQARRGYYAPKKSEDLAARADDEIKDEVFSRDELRELPMDVHTRFFKTDSVNAKLSVSAHVDVSSIHFRQEQDRHGDDMILVAALFDSDGHYLTGTQAKYELHLRDATFNQVVHSGIFLKANLDAKVGTYLMRVVVRDAESARLSTTNITVEIPY